MAGLGSYYETVLLALLQIWCIFGARELHFSTLIRIHVQYLLLFVANYQHWLIQETNARIQTCLRCLITSAPHRALGLVQPLRGRHPFVSVPNKCSIDLFLKLLCNLKKKIRSYVCK